jgi:hypothetical protein
VRSDRAFGFSLGAYLSVGVDTATRASMRCEIAGGIFAGSRVDAALPAMLISTPRDQRVPVQLAFELQRHAGFGASPRCTSMKAKASALFSRIG